MIDPPKKEYRGKLPDGQVKTYLACLRHIESGVWFSKIGTTSDQDAEDRLTYWGLYPDRKGYLEFTDIKIIWSIKFTKRYWAEALEQLYLGLSPKINIAAIANEVGKCNIEHDRYGPGYLNGYSEFRYLSEEELKDARDTGYAIKQRMFGIKEVGDQEREKVVSGEEAQRIMKVLQDYDVHSIEALHSRINTHYPRRWYH